MLAYGVNEGGGTSWSSTPAIVGLSVGGVALILLVIVELLHKNPLLQLRVFRSSDFTRGIILTWVMQAALFGSMLFVPLYLQQIRSYTPLEIRSDSTSAGFSFSNRNADWRQVV